MFDPGFDGRWKGCTVAGAHAARDFVPMTGPYKGKKVFVDGPEYKTVAGCGWDIGMESKGLEFSSYRSDPVDNDMPV